MENLQIKQKNSKREKVTKQVQINKSGLIIVICEVLQKKWNWELFYNEYNIKIRTKTYYITRNYAGNKKILKNYTRVII